MNNNLLSILPLLPIKRTVLFPGVMMPLTIGRERSMAAVQAAMKTEDKTIVVVAILLAAVLIIAPRESASPPRDLSFALDNFDREQARRAAESRRSRSAAARWACS